MENIRCHCCSGETKKSGKFRNRNRVVQRYCCKRCGQTFSEAQPLRGLRVETHKAIQIVRCLTDGCGIRTTSRLVGCHIETVLGVLAEMGSKCADLHDKLVRKVRVPEAEVDELWTFVQKKERRKLEADTTKGDQFTYVGTCRATKLIVAHLTGRRTYATTEAFCADLATRIDGFVHISTDAFRDYPQAIRLQFFGRGAHGSILKVFGTLLPGETQPTAQRFAPRIVTRVITAPLMGDAYASDICTSHVERLNLNFRTFCRRYARLSLCFSKSLDYLLHAVNLFVFHHNFIRKHITIKSTPAVAAGLADRQWTIEDLIGATI